MNSATGLSSTLAAAAAMLLPLLPNPNAPLPLPEWPTGVADGDGRRRRDERDDGGGEVPAPPGEREVRSDGGRRRLGEGGDETELLLAVGRRYDMTLDPAQSSRPARQHGTSTCY